MKDEKEVRATRSAMDKMDENEVSTHWRDALDWVLNDPEEKDDA